MKLVDIFTTSRHCPIKAVDNDHPLEIYRIERHLFKTGTYPYVSRIAYRAICNLNAMKAGINVFDSDSGIDRSRSSSGGSDAPNDGAGSSNHSPNKTGGDSNRREAGQSDDGQNKHDVAECAGPSDMIVVSDSGMVSLCIRMINSRDYRSLKFYRYISVIDRTYLEKETFFLHFVIIFVLDSQLLDGDAEMEALIANIGAK